MPTYNLQIHVMEMNPFGYVVAVAIIVIVVWAIMSIQGGYAAHAPSFVVKA